MPEIEENTKPLEQMTEQEFILHWEDKVNKLEKIKKEEMMLRKHIFNIKFNDPKEGTNTFDYGGGYVLKAKHKIMRKLIIPKDFPGTNGKQPTIVEAVDSLIDELRMCSNESAFKIDRLIRWTPSISDSEYCELSDKERTIVDKYIETKNGSPILTFNRPTE